MAGVMLLLRRRPPPAAWSRAWDSAVKLVKLTCRHGGSEPVSIPEGKSSGAGSRYLSEVLRGVMAESADRRR